MQQTDLADNNTMIPRFYCPIALVAGASLVLPEEVAHHAAKVLRLAVGDSVVLFNGEGGEYPARLTSVAKTVTAELGDWRAVSRESPLELTLVQALAAGDKMDWVFQKAVELGARQLVPVSASRSVLKLTGDRAEKRLEHWRSVVASACEQSGRDFLPTVAELANLPQYLGRLQSEPLSANSLRLILSPYATTRLAELPRPDAVTLMIGPEGGFTDDEVAAAEAVGFTAVRLGPRILRTETAGLAAMALLQGLWGDFD